MRVKNNRFLVNFHQNQKYELGSNDFGFLPVNRFVRKIRTKKTILKIISLHISDDLHDARTTITEQNRRLHELEIELRRLENEREELSAAYKEAEAVSSIQQFEKYFLLEIQIIENCTLIVFAGTQS